MTNGKSSNNEISDEIKIRDEMNRIAELVGQMGIAYKELGRSTHAKEIQELISTVGKIHASSEDPQKKLNAIVDLLQDAYLAQLSNFTKSGKKGYEDFTAAINKDKSYHYPQLLGLVLKDHYATKLTENSNQIEHVNDINLPKKYSTFKNFRLNNIASAPDRSSSADLMSKFNVSENPSAQAKYELRNKGAFLAQLRQLIGLDAISVKNSEGQMILSDTAAEMHWRSTTKFGSLPDGIAEFKKILNDKTLTDTGKCNKIFEIAEKRLDAASRNSESRKLYESIRAIGKGEPGVLEQFLKDDGVKSKIQDGYNKWAKDMSSTGIEGLDIDFERKPKP